jgi:uncharacterized membrane protein
LPLALSAAGLLIAVYLTVLHYNRRVPLYCAGSGFNCRAVLDSPASVLLGVPVSVAGILWFAVMVWVTVAMAGGVNRDRLLVFARGWAAAGMIGVLYFVYTEMFVVRAFCLWCTAVHGLVFSLFVTSMLAWEPGSGYAGLRGPSSFDSTASTIPGTERAGCGRVR